MAKSLYAGVKRCSTGVAFFWADMFRVACRLSLFFIVVFGCVAYVGQYYIFLSSRIEELNEMQINEMRLNRLQGGAGGGDIGEPRTLPVTFKGSKDNDTADPLDWKDRQKLRNAQKSSRRKAKRKGSIEKASKAFQVTRDYQVYEESESSYDASSGNLKNGSLEEGMPVWSEFADKGYTVVGTNGSATRRLPQVLIIGVKKSGTRALLAFLRVHPSIRAAGPEIHYFDRYYHRGLAWYRHQMPPSLEDQITVEKTPAYFTTPQVPERVKADLPGARLLLVVRDPVTRAISDYAQGLSKHGFRKSFEELAFVNATTGLVNSNWGPINGGLYAKHLKRWYDHFPRSSFHVVDGENLIQDPAAEIAKVQEFLGLRRVITDKHFFFNATKGFPCLVKRERSGRPHCLGSSKGRSHPSVLASTSETLRDFYRPFNFKFFKMIGHKYHW